MRRLTILAGALALMVSVVAEGRLYRWTDENGQVHYGDKPPLSQPRKGVSELGSSGAVRKSPETLTEEERLLQEEEARQANEQRRRDRALLQSFSRPAEVDLLRDRQVEAIQAVIQTNKIRRKNAQTKLERLIKTGEYYTRQKKLLPADLQTDIALARKEIDDIDRDTLKREDEIAEVKKRAHLDKQRLIELQGDPY
ncbi:DUF4124 domain-containing protein [Chitiniphilus purpureus]|uniref:DUF4124 domain-containing protein n=1 Tax=Chitiniphilus purpureus TaxID=2981137 RepID=A0ABY6DPZ5_9NEIS|nr:DUF4124 domain-containing protein [Chitiniphilus sp. CD1]UXY15773.1 DUF4124 domain-containing protein [Chitiniphilus sp. CD1]